MFYLTHHAAERAKQRFGMDRDEAEAVLSRAVLTESRDIGRDKPKGRARFVMDVETGAVFVVERNGARSWTATTTLYPLRKVGPGQQVRDWGPWV